MSKYGEKGDKIEKTPIWAIGNIWFCFRAQNLNNLILNLDLPQSIVVLFTRKIVSFFSEIIFLSRKGPTLR